MRDQPLELPRASGRADPLRERRIDLVEQRPRASGHDHGRAALGALERRGQHPRSGGIAALEVEHEHGLRLGGREQVLEAIEAPPRRRERPPVPVEQRPRGLQVPQLEPAAPEVEVGLDDVGARGFRSSQLRRIVAGAVRDQQWRGDHVTPSSKAFAEELAARRSSARMSRIAIPSPAIATMPPTITSTM